MDVGLEVWCCYLGVGVVGEEVDEQSQDDVFEEKMCEAIDGITQKSAQGRTNSLDAVSQALTKKYIPEFLIDRLEICATSEPLLFYHSTVRRIYYNSSLLTLDCVFCCTFY